MQWRSQLRRPVELILKLIEGLVFGTELDMALRTGLKHRQSVTCMLEAAPLSDLLEDIESELVEKVEAASGSEDQVDDEASIPEDDENAADLPQEVSREIAAAKSKSNDDDVAEKMQQFIDKCWRKIDTYVVLFQEPSDPNQVKDLLLDTEVDRLRKEALPDTVAERRFVLISYDLKMAGESSSHASTRVPPLRANGDHLKTLLRGCIAASDGDLAPRDLFLLFDGGRQGFRVGDPLHTHTHR